jgi:chaperonin GroES
MNIRPLHNTVIVEKEKEESISTGGISLITKKDATTSIGKVVDFGPGVYDEKGKLFPCGVKIGDRIQFFNSHHKKLKIEGTEYHFVKANGILCIIK